LSGQPKKLRENSCTRLANLDIRAHNFAKINRQNFQRRVFTGR
jgi:hypothetical protein